MRGWADQRGSSFCQYSNLFNKRKILVCKVIRGGSVCQDLPVFFPEHDIHKNLKTSVVSTHDHTILTQCAELGISNINLNWVETPEEIDYVRKILGNRGMNINLHVRIKSLNGLSNIEEILEKCEGIHLCRG
jgi:pyruvate kinase